MSRLGLGTWEVGDDPARRADGIAALRTGLDLGISMIDTAEMHGAGRAETLVGEAIAGRRVIPWCSAHGATVQAYTPLDQGRLAKSSAVESVAARHDAAPSAVALAWTIREPGVVSIAKTGRADRVRELAAAHPSPTRDGPPETI